MYLNVFYLYLCIYIFSYKYLKVGRLQEGANKLKK